MDVDIKKALEKMADGQVPKAVVGQVVSDLVNKGYSRLGDYKILFDKDTMTVTTEFAPE